MRLPIVLTLLFATSTNALSGPAQPARHVDLRDDAAVAELQRSNPRHYAQIQEIVAELLAEPRKAKTAGCKSGSMPGMSISRSYGS